jgi:hypothetical protein
MIIVSCSALIADSYPLMIVGSLLQSLSLFALSLAKPNQFYLVSSPDDIVDGSINVSLDFSGSRCSHWDWDGPGVCSQYGDHLSALLQKTHISNVSRCIWCTIWCRYTPDHAQSPFERSCWLFKRCPRQCGICQYLVADRLFIHAHESTADTFRSQLYRSGTEMLS